MYLFFIEEGGDEGKKIQAIGRQCGEKRQGKKKTRKRRGGRLGEDEGETGGKAGRGINKAAGGLPYLMGVI